jgi:hypothetical protein
MLERPNKPSGRRICEQHGERIQNKVFAEFTKQLGRQPDSVGGRWAIYARTLIRLRAIYNALGQTSIDHKSRSKNKR